MASSYHIESFMHGAPTGKALLEWRCRGLSIIIRLWGGGGAGECKSSARKND